MRPTPQEIIASVRTLLREHIAPELSPEAATHLRRIMSALRDGRWNEAAFDLLDENRQLAALIDGGIVQSSGSEPHAKLHARLRRIGGEYAVRGTPRSFAEANELNLQLRAALAAFIDAMRAGSFPDADEFGDHIALTMLNLQNRP